MRRVLGLLVGALLVATIGGCSSDGSDSPSSPAPRATQHAPAREALAAGLAKDDPTKADLVAEPETRLEPVEAPWLQGWQVFDVQSFTEYPQRFYAAVSDEGTAFVLSGRPDSFNTMVRDAKVVVDDEGIAADIAAVFLDVTRTFQTFSYRIDDLDEVQWRSVLNSDQQQRRSDLEAEYDDQVGPPAAAPSGTGWAVTVWMVDDRTLVRHRLTIGADGVVKDIADVLEADIPVPETY